MSAAIESLISAEEWEQAEDLIRFHLASDPTNHWLLTRLSLTFYERFDYEQALQYVTQAFSIAPHCPLVLWDYGGTLEMLDQPIDAMRVFRRLIRRGTDRIANETCGEGLARARGLIADCWYRISLCYRDLGQRRQAINALRMHLSLRGSGCQSIYPIREARKKLDAMEGRRLTIPSK